jgi:hypothetical protein
VESGEDCGLVCSEFMVVRCMLCLVVLVLDLSLITASWPDSGDDSALRRYGVSGRGWSNYMRYDLISS